MRRTLSRTLPRSEVAAEVAANLRANGFAWAGELIGKEDLETLWEAVKEKQPGRAGHSDSFGDHKDFWAHLLENELVDGSMPASNPFARFALRPQIISTLAIYYGELPRVDYVAMTLSRHSPEPLKFSQLWHRDYDDTKVVKLFVYLTDVDDANGPFTFLPGPVSDLVGFSRRSHRNDEEVGAKVDLTRAVRMKGPRLSAFFVETSRCLHMGSRVDPDHERLMYTASYFSAPRIFPERAKPFFRLDGTEGPIERLLLLPGSGER